MISRMVSEMIERILGIVPVQKVDNYKENRQSSRDTLKKQKEFDFEAILAKKMGAPPNEAYHIDLKKKL